jgi:ParB family transcriptional regulator, chromosome partitioning protein
MYSPGIFQAIPMDAIVHSSNILRNPHVSLDQLIASIMQKGLIHPILVRPINDNRYELIAGHRRFQACKYLGVQKIMCHIVDVDDKEAYEIAISENVQQQTMSPIEEALAFKRYIETFGWGGESNLASKIGKSQEYVSKRIKLLSLPESLQQDIVQGKINVSTAQELISLNDREVAENLGDYILENNLSARDARHVVRVFRGSLKNHVPQFKDQINNELGYVSTNIRMHSDDDDNNNNNNQSQVLFRIAKPVLRKCTLGIKLSLRVIDEVIGDLDEDDRTFRNSQNVWITKEMLMEHRFRLHEQLDQLLRETKKLKSLQKATA